MQYWGTSNWGKNERKTNVSKWWPRKKWNAWKWRRLGKREKGIGMHRPSGKRKTKGGSLRLLAICWTSPMDEILGAWSIERICGTDQSVIRDGIEYLTSRLKLSIVGFESFDSFAVLSLCKLSYCFSLLVFHFVKVVSTLPNNCEK